MNGKEAERERQDFSTEMASCNKWKALPEPGKALQSCDEDATVVERKLLFPARPKDAIAPFCGTLERVARRMFAPYAKLIRFPSANM